MKEKRNLSGIYFRCKESNGSYSNRCFEDLNSEDQIKYLQGRDKQWLESLIIKLSDILNEIGNEFDIIKE